MGFDARTGVMPLGGEGALTCGIVRYHKIHASTAITKSFSSHWAYSSP
jgi:hypothetical protein